MSDEPQSHDHLYEIPIEALGLSDVAIKAVKRTGITTVGDCIDFYRRGAGAMITVRSPFLSVMYGEVEEKLKAHSYWSFVESDTE